VLVIRHRDKTNESISLVHGLESKETTEKNNYNMYIYIT